MKKIMFNDRYGLTETVLIGTKTVTRREAFWTIAEIESFIYEDRLIVVDKRTKKQLVHRSRYKVGEIIAIAQRYSDIADDIVEKHGYGCNLHYYFTRYNRPTEGWYNKMFVKANEMPKRIKIMNIRCERLQDISNDDCLKEGICSYRFGFFFEDKKVKRGRYYTFKSAKDTFTVLIDKLNGKGFWESNPYVIVYEFELLT